MGRELIDVFFKFDESLKISVRILQNLRATWNLFEELLADESISKIYESEIEQSASTAIQIALVNLLDSLDVKPEMVLGHSSDEIVAVYAADALN